MKNSTFLSFFHDLCILLSMLSSILLYVLYIIYDSTNFISSHEKLHCGIYCSVHCVYCVYIYIHVLHI